MKQYDNDYNFETYNATYYDGPITKKIKCLFLFICFPIIPFIHFFPCDVKYQLVFKKEDENEEEDYIMVMH